jgi:hypothetical protein
MLLSNFFPSTIIGDGIIVAHHPSNFVFIRSIYISFALVVTSSAGQVCHFPLFPAIKQML